MPWPGCEPFHSRPDGARPPVSQRPRKLNLPANSRQSGPRAPLAVSSPAISLTTATVGRHRRPQKRLQTAANPPSTQIRARTIALVTPPLPASSRRPSVDSGLAVSADTPRPPPRFRSPAPSHDALVCTCTLNTVGPPGHLVFNREHNHAPSLGD